MIDINENLIMSTEMDGSHPRPEKASDSKVSAGTFIGRLLRRIKGSKEAPSLPVDTLPSRVRARTTTVERSSVAPHTGASRVRTTIDRPSRVVHRSSAETRVASIRVTERPREEVLRTPESRVVREALALPTIDAMRPESNKKKLFALLGVDIRQNSQDEHQDGVAYNPATKTLVVCDGMGGIGSVSELRNHFAWGLSHTIAGAGDLERIADDQNEFSAVIASVPQLLRSKGIDTTIPASGVRARQIMKGKVIGSTVAAVQHVEGAEWQALTLGDSSVLVVSGDGAIKDGFGESYQAWERSGRQMGEMVDDPPMATSVGLAADMSPVIVHEPGRDGFRAEFGRFQVEDGDRIVVASDAYFQKSPPSILIHDIDIPPENWNAMYSDDTTLAIINPGQM